MPVDNPRRLCHACQPWSPGCDPDRHPLRRSTISVFAVTYPSRNGGGGAGGTRRWAGCRRRSALRSGRCTGTVDAPAETGAVVFSDGAENWWSGRSRTSYETGRMRRVWVRGREQVCKRVLIQAAGCNLGIGTARSLQGRVPGGLFRADRSSDRPLEASRRAFGRPSGRRRPSSLRPRAGKRPERPERRTDFFHGLLGTTSSTQTARHSPTRRCKPIKTKDQQTCIYL